MRNIFITCITLLFTLISCDKNSDNDFKVLTTDYLENKDLLNCVNCFSVTNFHACSGFVIRDDKAYKIYADSMRIHPLNSNCDTATLIKIDFTKYSLVGIMTEHGACDSLKRDLIVDNIGKVIKYEIDIMNQINFATKC